MNSRFDGCSTLTPISRALAGCCVRAASAERASTPCKIVPVRSHLIDRLFRWYTHWPRSIGGTNMRIAVFALAAVLAWTVSPAAASDNSDVIATVQKANDSFNRGNKQE